MICLVCLEIRIPLSNLNFDVRILVQGHCVVIVTLFYFKVDIEQDAMRKPLVIKQETE